MAMAVTPTQLMLNETVLGNPSLHNRIGYKRTVIADGNLLHGDDESLTRYEGKLVRDVTDDVINAAQP